MRFLQLDFSDNFLSDFVRKNLEPLSPRVDFSRRITHGKMNISKKKDVEENEHWKNCFWKQLFPEKNRSRKCNSDQNTFGIVYFGETCPRRYTGMIFPPLIFIAIITSNTKTS